MTGFHRQLTLALACIVAAAPALLSQEPNLAEDQIREFLLKAKVVTSRQTHKGITEPWRLTLSNGTLTHYASFQAIDESRPTFEAANGTVEVAFRESYHFNIAAYELAKLLGLNDMMPVYVERRWAGYTGSLSWWLPVKMDEQDRRNRKLTPPDLNAWNMQVNRMWVFSQLVRDTDRNATNMLIGENWKLWMIDFTRAFRLHPKLGSDVHLSICDRHLLEKLRALNEAEVLAKTKPHLNKEQVKAVMARRDLIVAYFDKEITEKGEKAVLY